MHNYKKLLLAALAAALIGGGQATAEQPERRPAVTAPPPPEELLRGEDLQPEVTIVRRDWATIEEYSIGGRVYAVRVQPAVGPAYYFYDTNGDGALDTRAEVLQDVPSINRWKLLSW